MKLFDGGIPSQVLRDARCVHDMASLRLEDVQEAEMWLVVELHPGPSSGAATVPSKVVDGETGQVIDAPPQVRPPGSPEGSAILLEGAWRRVEALSAEGSAPNEGTYSWYEPTVTRQRETTADDFYNPFAKGGFVLGKFPCAERPERVMCPYFLLPVGWEASARQAYELTTSWNAGKKKDGYEAPVGKEEQASFVALQAIRAAAQEGDIKSAMLRVSSSQRKDVYLEAAVLYLLLLAQPDHEKEMLESFNAAVSRGSLKAVALALFTRLLLRRTDLRQPDLERHMLATLQTKAPREDPYFREIFRVSGLV